MPPKRKLCRYVSEIVTILSMLFIVACSKEPGSAPLPVTAVNQTLPFHRPSAPGGLAPTATLVPRGIQTRARVTARLSGNLTADLSQKGDPFVAELDEPLFFEGHIVSPRGSPVTGRILAVQPPTLSEEGFLRVTLDAVSVEGRMVPVKTSAVLLKGRLNTYAQLVTNPRELSSGTPQPAQTKSEGRSSSSRSVSYSGRRFTVRLTTPILLPN
jgi:hypothetical protein